MKRSQHVKHKKNYARPTKKQDKSAKVAKAAQNSISTKNKVFGKPIGSGKAKLEATKARREAAKSKALETQQNKLLNNGNANTNGKRGKDGKIKEQNVEKEAVEGEEEEVEEEEEEHDIADLMQMMEDDDELQMAYGAAAKRRKRDQGDGDEGKQHEVEHAHELDAKKTSKMQTVDLLPIKTKHGEIITRSTEVERKEKKVVNDDEEEDGEDDDGEAEYVDSDDDIVNDTREAGEPFEGQTKNAISTTDLLIYRDQEINRQKFRIANICSGILENPEHKMKNFTALFELMDDRINDTVNLFTVRKLAMTSLLEVFKDILPEYRIGQIDLKRQTGLLDFLCFIVEMTYFEHKSPFWPFFCFHS